MLPSVATLILTGLALLACGYGILAALSFMPRFRNFAREALPLMATQTLIIGCVAAAFWIGGMILDIALLALVFRCAWEAATVARLAHPHATLTVYTVAATTGIVAFLASVLPIGLLSAIILAALAITIYLRLSKRLQANPNVAFALDLALFPGLPVVLFAAAGLQGGYGPWLLVAFAIVETFDSYALAGGKLFGRHKAFPTLSPRKTVEGLVFGAIALMLTAALVAAILDLPLPGSMAVALFAGALTVAGDLAASALKRRAGVKDFPLLLRSQGGLLDIADAWIVTGAGLVALAALNGLA